MVDSHNSLVVGAMALSRCTLLRDFLSSSTFHCAPIASTIIYVVMGRPHRMAFLELPCMLPFSSLCLRLLRPVRSFPCFRPLHPRSFFSLLSSAGVLRVWSVVHFFLLVLLGAADCKVRARLPAFLILFSALLIPPLRTFLCVRYLLFA